MTLNVGLTYNLAAEIPSGKPDDFYAEYDSLDTIKSINNALKATGHSINQIEADENAYEKLKKTRPDIVFNIAEGVQGESRESHIPSILEMLGIPYTGSGPLTLALTLNKARAKEVMAYNRIPTPEFRVIYKPEETKNIKFKYPLIVKPLEDGSSRGISTDSIVETCQELDKKVRQIITVYGQPALLEKFLPGREFTVAVLGNDDLVTLPVIEIYMDMFPKESRGVYGFEAKFRWDDDSHSGHPRKMPEGLEELLTELAVRTHRVLGCRDYSRVDIRLDEEGRPNVIEINPLPGLNPKIEAVSYFPKAARMAGWSFEKLIIRMLDTAIKRYGLEHVGAVKDAGVPVS